MDILTFFSYRGHYVYELYINVVGFMILLINNTDDMQIHLHFLRIEMRYYMRFFMRSG